MTECFNQALRDLPRADQLTIVAISMPCGAVRNAMKDPAVDRSIARVVTLGGFFRGSPLFCAGWMQQTIRKRHLSPLCRFDRWLAYKIYFAYHKNLLLDYRWDNADGEMPMPAATPSHSLKDPRAQSKSATKTEAATPTYQPSDSKFVVYAGFLHNQYTPKRHGAVRAFLLSPYSFLFTTLPAHFSVEHPALRFLNDLIAGAVPGKAKASDIIYPFNDGISPITSNLLLSDDFVADSVLRTEEDLKKIAKHSYAKRARLFDDIDHLTFIEEHRPIGSSKDVVDILSSIEKPRPMFAWILTDLLE